MRSITITEEVGLLIKTTGYNKVSFFIYSHRQFTSELRGRGSIAREYVSYACFFLCTHIATDTARLMKLCAKMLPGIGPWFHHKQFLIGIANARKL